VVDCLVDHEEALKDEDEVLFSLDLKHGRNTTLVYLLYKALQSGLVQVILGLIHYFPEVVPQVNCYLKLVGSYNE
jgi:hypothetical protein